MKKIITILSLILLTQCIFPQKPEEKKIETLIDEILKKIENYYSSEEIIPEQQIQKQKEMQRQLERIKKQLELLQKQKEFMDAEKFQEEIQKIQKEAIEIQKKSEELLEILKEKQLFPISPTFRFKGDTEIGENDFIEGDVVVEDGDLIVYGRVNGNILVENGDVIIKNGAEVTGNIYTTNGEIKISEKAKFTGQRYENFSPLAEIDRITSYNRKKHRMEIRYRQFYEEQPGVDNFYFEFERVSGFKIGVMFPRKYTSIIYRPISMYGYGGYATKLHRWIFSFGIDRALIDVSESLSKSFLLIFGGRVFSTIGTKDDWLISPNANTISALIWNNDYRDYFKHEGFDIYFDIYIQNDFLPDVQNFKINYSNANYGSETTKYIRYFKWNEKRPFRDNPAVYEGNLKSLSLSYRTGKFKLVEGFKKSGFGMFINFERELGKFNYNILIVEFRARLNLSNYDNFGLRFRVASSDKVLPKQKSFELGGFGTLYAFPYKSFEGNKMMLANIEYILKNPVDIFDFVNFFIFFDAGYVQTAEGKITSGFKIKNINEIKSDFGFGFGTESMKTRIYFAWRTDAKMPPIIVVRLSNPF